MNITDREQLIFQQLEHYWQDRQTILTGGKQPNNFEHLYQTRSLIADTGKIYTELNLLEQYRYLVIWGTMGAGKTYLLYSIARSVLASNHLLFPLWLDLNSIKSSFLEEIYQQNPIPREDITYLLTVGKGLLLVDNFDRSQGGELRKLCNYYGKNTIVITTRDYLRINEFSFPVLKLINFSREQLKKFFSFYYPENYILHSEILHGQEEIYPLLTTPLFLDILCNTPIHYDTGKLLQIWIDLINPSVIDDANLKALEKLALFAIAEHQSKLSRSTIEGLCRQEAINPIEFIYRSVSAGILVEYQDSYQFAGQGVTNYLAAQEIAYMKDPYTKWDYQRKLSIRVNQSQYHSLIKFLWEFLQDKQQFVALVKTNIENIILPNSLEASILEWIDQQLCSTSLQYTKEVNQSIYLSFLLSTQFSTDMILLPSQSLPILLEPKLAVPLSLIVAPTIALDMAINISLYRALDEPTKFSNQSIKAQTQIQRYQPEEFIYWWESQRQETTDILKFVQEQCSKYVRIANLTAKQLQKLKDYYQAKFLVAMCEQLHNDTVEAQNIPPTLLDEAKTQQKSLLENLQQEVQALKVKTEFLLLERSKITTGLDQVFKLCKKLQPKIFLIDQLLNSHVWKKLEQQIKQNPKDKLTDRF